MSWSRFDDLYDEHEKIAEAWFRFPPNPVGLHVMATTACNRWLSDGVIRPRWLIEKLPKLKDRTRVLGAMVEVGLLDVLPAGTAFQAVDSSGNEIHAGPFQEDRYVVHDFLDRHDSSVQIKERRAKDATRKAVGRRTESNGSPNGVHAESAGSPRASRARVPSLPIPKDPPSPPKSGGRQRDRLAFERDVKAYAEHVFGEAPNAVACVKQAITYAKTPDTAAVIAFAREHFPDLTAVGA